MFQLHGFGFAKVFVAFGHINSVKPCFFGRMCVIKNKMLVVMLV